jgi:catechol 2,3-dioxygenase-like lactoylglutathione lyase family enzyme
VSPAGETAARLHHVNLVVPAGQAGEIAAFYRDVFGFVDLDRPGGQGAGGWWLEADDGVQLHLSENDRAPHPDAHIAITVGDFGEVRSRLAAVGAAWRDAPDVFGGGGRGFTRDPAGNRIEVLG